MLSSLKDKNFFYPFTIWFIIIFWYLIILYGFHGIAVFRFKTQDFFDSQSFFLFPRYPQEAKQIAIVAIDRTSLAKFNLKWPWPRSVYAQLIRAIASSSPKVIGLDIVFSGKSEEAEDKELASALKSYPNIVLAYRLGRGSGTLPLPEFIKAARAIGFVDRPQEKSKFLGVEDVVDDVIRSVRTFYIDSQRKQYSLEVEALRAYLDIPYEEIKIDTKGLSLGDKLYIPGVTISSSPESAEGIAPLNYLVYYNKFDIIPVYRVLENKFDRDIFKGKIVLVGATDPLIHDEHPTPLGTFPGVTIIANSLVMMLTQRFIHNLPMWLVFFIIFVLGSLIIFINKKAKFFLASTLTFLILAVLFVSTLYLRGKDIQYDYFSVFSSTFLAYMVSNIYKYSYLLYMSNKLKNLAITDPLTGFFSNRYFLLKLDDELKNKLKSVTFLVFIIANYGKLATDLNFEHLKNVIKSVADYIRSYLEERCKKIEFSRLKQEAFFVAVWEKKKEAVVEVCKELHKIVNNTEFRVDETPVKVSLKSIAIHKSKHKKIYSKTIIYTIDSLLKHFEKEVEETFVNIDLEEKMWEEKSKTHREEDILDFLVKDLEERNRELEKTLKELLESKRETEEAYFETIRSLIKALEEKDTYTQGHSQRVAGYALAIAKEVGLSGDKCDLIYKAALLHDIGKIGIPDYILRKKERLTEEEYALIRKHQTMSIEILKPIKAFKDLLPIILHHHERFDGTGYPYGLSGDMIPKEAQILAVADAFDAITCGRGYKKGSKLKEGIEELERNSGTQFNPVYVEALKKALASEAISIL